jgi:hypothetical protein
MSDQVAEATYAEEDIQRAAEEINNMTPDGYLELESMVKSIEDINAIPEAGGIIFTEITNNNGAILHPTARATHPIRCVQMLIELLNYLRSLQPDAGWKLRVQDYSAVKQASQAVTNEAQYVDEGADQPDAEQPQNGRQSMQIAKVEITPMPDNRVGLKMYAPGHRFPDLQVTNWTAKSVLENLIDPNTGWDMNTLSTANEFTGNYIAEWEFSKTNTKQSGEPYKDLKRLAVA